ncbi:MAG: hypothetical protein J0L82_18355 [Deltaproteobacteria bacterium]|nr:hypothetical protein [Deltaproteobacteria bacterium]
MSKIRAVRLSEHEEKLVQSFLKKNSLFDFTTLVRAALREFIKHPHMSLNAVQEVPKKSKVSTKESRV